MTTKISLLTGLITALLFAAALPSAANDSKKQRNKAHKQMGQGQSQSSNPTPTPTPSWLYLDLPKGQKQKDQAQSQAAAQAKAENRYFGQTPPPTPKPSKNIGDFVSGQTVPNGVQVPKPTSSATSAFSSERYGSKSTLNPKPHAGIPADKTYDGAPILYSKATPTPSAEADESSSNDMQGQHKKNKNKHHHHHDGDGHHDND